MSRSHIGDLILFLMVAIDAFVGLSLWHQRRVFACLLVFNAVVGSIGLLVHMLADAMMAERKKRFEK